MKTRLTKDELAYVNQATAYHAGRIADRLAHALDLAADGRKTARVAARECRFCFYQASRICGQAFTDWKCAHCDFTDSHPNTGVPRVCNDCSDDFGLCTSCGSDIDMRPRHRVTRKKKPRARKAKP